MCLFEVRRFTVNRVSKFVIEAWERPSLAIAAVPRVDDYWYR
jgi:hypothetical protein